jgi:hypothetical protein
MTPLTAILLFGGGLTICSGWVLYNRKRMWRLVTALIMWLIALVLLTGSGYSYWYHHRPRPELIHNKVLFEGITYTREVRTAPRPIVMHIITVALDAPGIGFFVTPSDPTEGRQLPARKTSQFLREFGTQVAINASFFTPFYVHWPLYYPHIGDPVDVRGLAISLGQRYSPPKESYTPLYLTQDNRASIGQPLEDPYNVISGSPVFVKAGTIPDKLDRLKQPYKPHPRTAIALDKTQRRLMLFVVDGRQPNYSEGITLSELAQVVLKYGGYTAFNLDGGGSSALVIEGADGKPVILNSPIHLRVPPGRERPVANHLGIFARPQQAVRNEN